MGPDGTPDATQGHEISSAPLPLNQYCITTRWCKNSLSPPAQPGSHGLIRGVARRGGVAAAAGWRLKPGDRWLMARPVRRPLLYAYEKVSEMAGRGGVGCPPGLRLTARLRPHSAVRAMRLWRTAVPVALVGVRLCSVGADCHRGAALCGALRGRDTQVVRPQGRRAARTEGRWTRPALSLWPGRKER